MGAPHFSLELTKINLEGAQLDGAHLEAAVVQANLKKARLVGTHLESAIVINSELEEANLSGAHLEGTSFLDVKLAGANFAGAHVRRTSFDRTDLSEVTNFSQEMLEQANGDWSTTPPKECQAPEWWSTLPGYNGPLRPGSYGVKLCARALFFDVDEGWYSRLSLPNSVFITPTGITHLGSMLSLHNIQWVRDPNKPTEEHEILRTPPDLAAWLLEHPALEVESQEEAQIGNASGVQFDAIIPRGQGIDVGAHRPGFPMFPLSRAAHFTLLEGNKNRFIVLNVGDETMTIIVESPAKEFDKFFARTNELLATVKWQDLP